MKFNQERKTRERIFATKDGPQGSLARDDTILDVSEGSRSP